jgi:hypothetical protein
MDPEAKGEGQGASAKNTEIGAGSTDSDVVGATGWSPADRENY